MSKSEPTEAEIERVAEAIQRAWDSCPTLPPLILTEAEGALLARAAIGAREG